jgi:Domain of unknown function (DUF4355)
MPDETPPITPATPPVTPTTPPATPTPPAPETFTKDQVEAMVKTQLEAADKTRAEKDAEAKRLAEMTAEQRAKEFEEKAKTLEADYAQKVLDAQRKAELAGKVSNVDRLLKLMDKPETYFDGATPKLEAILKDFPEYAAKAISTAVEGANGSKSGSVDLDKAVSSGDSKAINAAFDALLKKGR